MILIADSGSTKTTWSLCKDGKQIKTCTTSGINPFYLEKQEIFRILQGESLFLESGIETIFFYGAGCIPPRVSVVSEALKEYFGIENVNVNTDLLGAARSLCGNQPGIACILGTGSNSCFYDGEKIISNISPLGFILGDEGSGAALGKKLLADILKNQFPEEIKNDFFAQYPQSPAEILENVYRKPFPNRYLAQFAVFLAKHIENPAISKIIDSSFDEFIERNIMQYPECKTNKISFTGSVAYYFRDNLERALERQGLNLGTITQSPMEGLILKHGEKQINTE